MPTYYIEEVSEDKHHWIFCCITQLLIELLPNQILVCTIETRSIVGLINTVGEDQLQSN